MSKRLTHYFRSTSTIRKSQGLALLITTMVSTNPAYADSYNARNLGMGGTGVASSNYEDAAGVNPALLTEFRERDHFALVVPAIGFELSDKNEVIASLDDISTLFDTLDTQISNSDPAAASTAGQIISELEGLSGKPIEGNAGGRIGIAVPGKRFAFAIELSTSIEGGGLGTWVESDQAVIFAAIAANDPALLDNLNSTGSAVVAGVSELSFAMATEFTPGNDRLSIGFTPKYQRVDTVLYHQKVSNFDSGNIDSNEFRNDKSNFNMDLGIAWWFGEKTNIGFAVTNVIRNTYSTEEIEGLSTEYTINPVATLGVAWNGPLFTFAFDADLNSREGFGDFGKTQFVRAGFEFNAANWAAIRTGVRHDLEDNRNDVLTLGVGFSPFGIWHLDFTGMVGKNATYGGVFEMKFTL